MKTLEERFWEKVNIRGDDECWNWTAAHNNDGRGNFHYNGTITPASRMVLMLSGISLENGLCALHKCDNPACCNPNHIYAGTRSQNNIDAIKRGRFPQVFLIGHKHGEDHPAAKLTRLKVDFIRDWCCSKKVSQKLFSEWFGVSKQIISDIVHHKKWRETNEVEQQ